jgi:hypothetical protein
VRLEHRRGLVAEAHDKLSAILDPTLSSRDLLYGVLETWVEMPEGFGVRFSAQQESELEAVRFGDGSPVQRLKAFLEPYASFIEAAGRPLQQIRRILDTEVPLLERLSAGHAVNALFAERGGSAGRALRVFISIAPGTGEEFGTNTVDETMKVAVRQGVAVAFTLAQMPREPNAVFTGTIAPDGAIGAVQHVAAKVAAAGRAGVSRVFVPIDNFEEAKAAAIGFAHLHVIGVSSLAEAWSALAARPRSASAASTSLSAEVRRVELECLHAGMKVYDKVKRTGQVQLEVTDGTSKGSITVYQGKSGLDIPR